MRDNRPFSDKEDEIIINLYQHQNIKKWSMIARTLTEEYNLPRNAKQCRDRYNQYLNPMMVSEWTHEEEEKLYQLHDEIGNKWAVIAQKLPGRTDNCVKNHFYSKLRKSLRHLNKLMKAKLRKEFKQLKMATIYKIIEALEERFNENTSIEQDVFAKCLLLKRNLLEYSSEENNNEGPDFSRERELIHQILEFNKTYKRKTKKERRNSLSGIELFKPVNFQKRMKYASDQSSSDSEYSLHPSQKDDSKKDSDSQSESGSQQSQVELGIIEEEDIRESHNTSYIRGSLASNINIRDSHTSNFNIRESHTSNFNIRESHTSNLNIRESQTSNIRQSQASNFNIQDSHTSNINIITDSITSKCESPENKKIKEEPIKNQLKMSAKSQGLVFVEDLLRGVMEEGEIFVSRPEISLQSVSLRSESERGDMFDDNLRISEKHWQVQEMEEQENSIFRSQK